MRSLTPYERIKAMVAGREVDRPGASVWKHFHQDDSSGYTEHRCCGRVS